MIIFSVCLQVGPQYFDVSSVVLDLSLRRYDWHILNLGLTMYLIGMIF
jgi:hypothetical protein